PCLVPAPDTPSVPARRSSDLARLTQRGEAGLLRASGGVAEPGELENHPGAVLHLPQGQGQVLPAGLHPHFGPATARGLPGVLPPDRKSTRLNSSHVKISYAVV